MRADVQADLVLVMERGRVMEAGTHPELVAAGARHARLHGIQERAYTAGIASPSPDADAGPEHLASRR